MTARNLFLTVAMLMIAWPANGQADTPTTLDDKYGPFNRGMSTEDFNKLTAGSCQDATFNSSPGKLCSGTTNCCSISLSKVRGGFLDDKLYSLFIIETGAETEANGIDAAYSWAMLVVTGIRKYGAPSAHIDNLLARVGVINDMMWHFSDDANLAFYVSRDISLGGNTKYVLSHSVIWPKP